MPTIALALIKAVELTPNHGEQDHEFVERLLKAVNELDEPAFDALPEDAQNWFNDAVLAKQHSQPVQELPGLAALRPVQAKDAAKPNGADEEASAAPAAEPPRRKPSGPVPKATREGRKPGKRRSVADIIADGEPENQAAIVAELEAEKEAAKDQEQAKRERKEKEANKDTLPSPKVRVGVLDMIMEEALLDRKATPTELKERVEKKYPDVVVKQANAIGMRQQWRRVVRFLQRKGLLTKDLVD